VSKLQSFGLLLAFLTSSFAFAAYNEAFDENGDLRAPYVEYEKNNNVKIYPVSEASVQTMMNAPLQDKVKMLPIPLIISASDYETLQKGTLQRMRALKAFFADVVFNNGRKAIDAGIITEQQINQLWALENPNYSVPFLQEIWQGRTVDDIRFLMGSDVVRNEEGKFVVLEDNIGPLGGLGDVVANHSVYNAHIGQPMPEYQAPIERALRAYLKDIPPEKWAESVLVVYTVDESKESIKLEDNESMRIGEIFKKLNLKVISTKDFNNDEALKPVIDGTIKKIVNFYEPASINLAWERFYSLLSKFKDKSVQFMTSPGVETLGTKAMLPFVEKFIEFYLQETPIIKTQPTEWILGDESLVEKGWWIKKATGSQGSEVFRVRDLLDSGIKNLKESIHSWSSYSRVKTGTTPSWYVRQKEVDPSFLPSTNPASWVNFNVDFRPHILAVSPEVEMPIIWGRANWKLPGQLNNVSQGAFEMVIQTANGECERKLLKPQ